ncbi:MAG: hypothetical protein GXP59_02790 [Deltaproteobacteria bacterium]|nr:hypothetical protein [Deltaproteobacteria bacterium]
MAPLLITTNQMLRRRFNELQRGDIIIGRVSLRPSEEHLLLDLVERGVRLIPSALSQLLSRSKTMQSELLAQWLPPRTRAIHDIHQLLEAMPLFGADEKIVTKLDRKNAGLGIHLWPTIEDVYTHASLANLSFPFVIQPFQRRTRDVRVLIIGNFIEAYERYNAASFRNNLHCGAEFRPWKLTPAQLKICRQVMARGKFPYAHLDLMIGAEDDYLLEINLRGGIRGAMITAPEYEKLLNARHQEILTEIVE